MFCNLYKNMLNLNTDSNPLIYCKNPLLLASRIYLILKSHNNRVNNNAKEI
jgi:hypothetical protein